MRKVKNTFYAFTTHNSNHVAEMISSGIFVCSAHVKQYKELKKSGKIVYKILLVFDEIFDRMNDVDRRKLLESLIAEINLYPKETWEENKNPIREIKYTFPISDEAIAALSENETSVETIVLLSHRSPDSHINVKVEFGEGEGKVPLDAIAERAKKY